MTPIGLDEARGMNVEDVVLVATVREHIRSKAIQSRVNSTEISRRVEAMQAGTLGPATDDELEASPIGACNTFALPDSPRQPPRPPISIQEGGRLGKTSVRSRNEYK